MPAAAGPPPAAAVERLAGPSGPGARGAAWDSALLELRGPPGGGGGTFSLELWRFHEAWQVPFGPEHEELADAAGAPPGEVSRRPPGRPAASVLHREEHRVLYEGTFEVQEVPAVRLAGFSRSRLSQAYVEKPELAIAAQPTWWSEDGRHFIYYAEEYAHWKVNASREASGDGMRAVRPGGRRAGQGFAHSGPAPRSADGSAAAAAALLDPLGWFEAVDGEWTPVEPEVSQSRAWALHFRAARVKSDEHVIHGEDSSRELHSAGPVAFRGLRCGGPGAGPAVLFLPPLCPPLDEGAGAQELLSEAEEVAVAAVGACGDPEVLALEPSREARL